MSSIPEGARVKVDFSKAPEHFGLPHSVSRSKIYKGVMLDDNGVKFDENIGGWGGGYCWHCPSECITQLDIYLIPTASMKRVYDVACDAWKSRISSMIKPFDEHFVCTKRFAKEMIAASNDEQKIVVIEVLTEAGYKSEADKSKKYHIFDTHGDKLLGTETHVPMYLRNGLASSECMQFREIGFGSNYKPILVDGDGNETVLNSDYYLKFKVQ